MMREGEIEVGGCAASPTREELRRRLLALVLAAVLVWYTVVVPAGAYAKNSAPQTPDDEGRDGEVRGRRNPAPVDARAYSVSGAREAFEFGEDTDEAARASVEDLDWPEYIYPD